MLLIANHAYLESTVLQAAVHRAGAASVVLAAFQLLVAARIHLAPHAQQARFKAQADRAAACHAKPGASVFQAALERREVAFALLEVFPWKARGPIRHALHVHQDVTAKRVVQAHSETVFVHLEVTLLRAVETILHVTLVLLGAFAKKVVSRHQGMDYANQVLSQMAEEANASHAVTIRFLRLSALQNARLATRAQEIIQDKVPPSVHLWNTIQSFLILSLIYRNHAVSLFSVVFLRRIHWILQENAISVTVPTFSNKIPAPQEPKIYIHPRAISLKLSFCILFQSCLGKSFLLILNQPL
jgi:hypothetical protein